MSNDKNDNRNDDQREQNDNRQQWEDEKKKAAEFWANFLANLLKFKEERAKNDPVYQKESVLFSVNTGTFQHDFKYDDEIKLLSIMANASFSDFEATRNAFLQWKITYAAKNDTKEPKKADFFLKKNYEQALLEWKYEKGDAKDFANDFENLFNQAQQGKVQNDLKYQYQRINIVWNCTALGKTFDTSNVDRKELQQYGVSALEDARKELKDDYSQILQTLQTKEPQANNFFVPQNYSNAINEWQKNKNEWDTFVTRIDRALRKTISTLKKQTKAQAQSQTQQQTNTAPPVVDVPQGFPDDPNSLKVVKSLGGSTGAELVEAPDGTRYVRKRGNNEGHVRNECYADAFYRAAGADIPEFRLYDTPKGPVKLSRYYEGTQSLKDWWKKATQKEKDAMSAELRKQYATDVLLGNWDVVGQDADNILIDKHGKPWRIDNGGAMSYKATGGAKPDSAWNDGFVDDLWTMTGNGQRIGNNASSNIPTYFGQVDVGEMAKDINGRDWSAALARLPIAERAVGERRLEEVRQLAAREEDFSTHGYTREFTLSILDETYKFSKKGLREACDFTCDLQNGDYGWFRSNSGKGGKSTGANKDSNLQSAMLKALKSINTHNKAGGDKQPNMTSVQAALDWEKDLTDALNQGAPNAQYYLDILQQIKDAVKNQTTLPQTDVTKNVWTNWQLAQQQPTATPVLRAQHSSLSQYLRAELGNDAVDFIEDCNHSQARDSYEDDACKTKILRLRAQGYDFNKYKTFDQLYQDATADGYYLGIPNDPKVGWQYDAIKGAFDYFKANKNEYDKRYVEMTRYNAAIQIALENSTFTGNDRTTRSLILDRTEKGDVVFPNGITLNPGDKCVHKTGVNESHSVYKTFCFKGHNLTMVRVPYSRINGLYMMERGLYKKSSTNLPGMFAGPNENEIVADTHGLTVYFMKENVSSGDPLSKYMAQFEQYEKNNP